MTLAASTRRNDYVGNGSVNNYDYTFKLFSSNDIRVLVADDNGVEFPDLALGVDYSIDGVGDAAGGTVTLINAAQAWLDGGGDLLTNYTISLIGNMSPSQDTSIRNQGPYFPSVIEDRFDKIIAGNQETNERLSRAILSAASVPLSGITIDPAVPLQFLRWNAAGDGIESVAVLSSTTPVSGEAPSGAINNSNVNFTIANAANAGTFKLYKNGLRLTSADFTLVGTALTMTTAPNFFEQLLCDYEY